LRCNNIIFFFSFQLSVPSDIFFLFARFNSLVFLSQTSFKLKKNITEAKELFKVKAPSGAAKAAKCQIAQSISVVVKERRSFHFQRQNQCK
jgi:hypothetical protein